MKIQCPKCKRSVPPEQINVGTDVAFCPKCNEGFKISESVEQDAINPDILQNPPKGAWFKRELNEVIVGASTRSPVAAFLMIPFMCVWSGGSLGGIYGSQIIKGEFDLSMSFFGIPFLIGTIILGTIALMSVCGKVEVSVGRLNYVFIGIGPFGWKRHFDWASVHTIREDGKYSEHSSAIVLEGKDGNRLKFGSRLNENRKYFILNVLKYLKAEYR